MTLDPAQIRTGWTVPVDPDTEQGRQWAVEELSKQPYQAAKPGLLQQIWQAVSEFFGRLLEGLQNFTGADSSLIGTVMVLVVILLLAGLIFILRPKLSHRRKPDAEVFAGEQTLSAQEHRSRAAESAAAGNYDDAVAEVFRAIVRAAEERAIIDPQPGRTAAEVANTLGTAFGTEADHLQRAAALFNRVRYTVRLPGATQASLIDYQRCKALDESLDQLRPEHHDRQLTWVAPQ